MRREAVVDAAAMWGMLAVAFASPARADLRNEVQSTTTGAAVTSRPAREKTGVSVCGPIKSLASGRARGTGSHAKCLPLAAYSFPGGSDLAINTCAQQRPTMHHTRRTQSKRERAAARAHNPCKKHAAKAKLAAKRTDRAGAFQTSSSSTETPARAPLAAPCKQLRAATCCMARAPRVAARALLVLK